MQKVTEYFNALGKEKIHFTPQIKIKLTPHSAPLWIDNIYRVKDTLMVSISTEDDNCKKMLSACNEKELSSLTIRLYSMIPKQVVETSKIR